MIKPLAHRCVVTACCFGFAALACSETLTGPSTINLPGRWVLGFTSAESAFTCHFDSVFVLFFDSTVVSRGVVDSSTAGTCVGRGRNDTAFLAHGSVDSIVLGSGLIRFRTHSGAFHYSGRLISLDSMAGAMTEDGLYSGIGAIHLTGAWGARRLPPPP